jgi:hypothetical protein
VVDDQRDRERRDRDRERPHRPGRRRGGRPRISRPLRRDQYRERQHRPRGRRHYWFRVPNTIRVPNSTGKVAPSLDIRGDGGYVIAPPSIHPSGRAYTWVDQRQLQPLPRWLLERAARPKPAPTRTAAAAPPAPGVDRTRYGIVALRNETDRVRHAPDGARNDSLNRAAYSLAQLVAAGHLPHSLVHGELEAAGIAAGLGQHETLATIASAIRAGLATPREATREV